MLARVALFEGADVFISLLSQTEVFCLFFFEQRSSFFEKKQQQRSSVNWHSDSACGRAHAQQGRFATAIATRELVSW